MSEDSKFPFKFFEELSVKPWGIEGINTREASYYMRGALKAWDKFRDVKNQELAELRRKAEFERKHRLIAEEALSKLAVTQSKDTETLLRKELALYKARFYNLVDTLKKGDL